MYHSCIIDWCGPHQVGNRVCTQTCTHVTRNRVTEMAEQIDSSCLRVKSPSQPSTRSNGVLPYSFECVLCVKSKFDMFGAVFVDAGSLQPTWRHRRFWYQPQPHRFAQSVAASSDMRSVSMEFDMGAPALAYIWDHQVRHFVVSWFRFSG